MSQAPKIRHMNLFKGLKISSELLILLNIKLDNTNKRGKPQMFHGVQNTYNPFSKKI